MFIGAMQTIAGTEMGLGMYKGYKDETYDSITLLYKNGSLC